MKASRYTISTLKETPSDAEIASHRLLIRGGFIKKLASGIYSWMPIGLRVLRKIEAIVREEMNRAGAQEVLMPNIQPAELWQESGRWQQYDEGLLLKLFDRNQREFCFGPTHEEVITEIARSELRSHKQLPVNFYQVQTKFRDETRPRFGLMRAREFIMKDAYSFHLDEQSLDAEFRNMYDAYSRIFSRMQLDFRAVIADAGAIGGNASMEFHVLADAGEDRIAFSNESDYAANIEMAESAAPSPDSTAPAPMETIETPNARTIEAVSNLLGVDAKQTVKTLIVKGAKAPLIAIVLRGDHQLNEVKAAKAEEVASPLTMAAEAEIRAATGSGLGSLGPVGLEMPILVDRDAAAIANFVCGANRDGYHHINVNWQRDASATRVLDLRDVLEGDPSPDGKGTLSFKRGIEVGHIFKLGDKYSKPMNATVLDESGKAATMMMGCYGIGVSRLVAATIEQYHDDKGMVWPTALAPFEAVVIPVNAHRSEAVQKAADEIYAGLIDAGIEVLLDDRDGHRPGAKFADAELIGYPHRIVVGDRGLESGVVEYTCRKTNETTEVSVTEIIARIVETVRSERT
ncbi:MAG: proline--tRNA ligase [Pseudomonadales bacterium]|nr:proline--tRNA ligase [Pseudomonadales bacterium]